MQQIVTGEAVALELRPAALPSRAVAAFLDAMVQLALLFGLLALLTAVGSQTSDAAGSAMGLVVLVLVGIGYPVAFESLMRGRTPGKAAMGLRVVRSDGGPIGFRHAFVRGLAGAFIERPGITLYVAGIVTMLLNGRSQRIGDLLSGSVVLQERVAVRGGTVATMPPELTGWAASLDLSGLSDELALSVRQFVGRSSELTATAREDLGGRLVSAVLAVVTPPPPPGTPGWAVLAAVLAERRRREEQRLATGPAASGWDASPAAAAARASGRPANASAPAPYPPGSVPPPAPPTSAPPAEPPSPGPGGFVVPG